jgi:hypothetical protein
MYTLHLHLFISLYLYLSSFISHLSSLHLSSLISSSLHLFISLYLYLSSLISHLFISSSLHLFISSSLHLFISSSLHLFISLSLISSSLHLFISYSLIFSLPFSNNYFKITKIWFRVGGAHVENLQKRFFEDAIEDIEISRRRR